MERSGFYGARHRRCRTVQAAMPRPSKPFGLPLAGGPCFKQLEVAANIRVAWLLLGGGEQILTRLHAVSLEQIVIAEVIEHFRRPTCELDGLHVCSLGKIKPVQ